MGNGSGVSRGGRNRNARLERLRGLVPVANAIAGIDLAGGKQMVIVTDDDSKVIARRTFGCRAWDLGAALGWADRQATARGWAGVTVRASRLGTGGGCWASSRLTGRCRWRVVHPLVTSWARRTGDLTCDKTDDKDAVLIARLAAQLRCYVPEPADETWGRLRHLGNRREQLITEAGSQVQQMRDLLECAWPAALDTARQPFRSRTWIAALLVIAGRDGGDLTRTRRLGPARFERQVRREVSRRGRQKPCLRIVRGLFAALGDHAGVITHRRGALERVQLLLDDWQHAKQRLADTEQQMTAVLDELGLTSLVTSITGISAVGAAAILAETGDPRRFATARALVKHAGLAPRENLSGAFTGRTRLTGQGRPGLRLAAWRAVWAARRANPVYRARLPVPDQPGAQQADAHPGADRHRRRDPAAPACRHHHRPGLGLSHRHPRHPAAAQRTGRLARSAAFQAGGRGEPSAALRHHGDLGAHHGQPRPSSFSTRSRAAGPSPITAMQGQTTDQAPAKKLDANRLTLMCGRYPCADKAPDMLAVMDARPTIGRSARLRNRLLPALCGVRVRFHEATPSQRRRTAR
jgi:transposase